MTKQTLTYLSNKNASSLASYPVQTDDWAESNLIICLCPSHLMSVLSTVSFLFVFSLIYKISLLLKYRVSEDSEQPGHLFRYSMKFL